MKEENPNRLEEIAPTDKESLSCEICAFYRKKYEEKKDDIDFKKEFVENTKPQYRKILGGEYNTSERIQLQGSFIDGKMYYPVKDGVFLVFPVFYQGTNKVVGNIYSSKEGILKKQDIIDCNLHYRGGINVNFMYFVESIFENKEMISLEEFYGKTLDQMDYDFRSIESSLKEYATREKLQMDVLKCCIEKMVNSPKTNLKIVKFMLEDLQTNYPDMRISTSSLLKEESKRKIRKLKCR